MGYLELAKRIETEGKTTTAIQSVPPETLESIFQEVLNDLLGEANPSMLAQEQEAKNHLDKIWADCLAGRASIEDFKKAVAQWHGAVISLFTSPQAQGSVSQERLL
ncbi:MAG: hypothetical protein Q6354_07420 [Candidatus Brocadiales bacterium]|nr:hypothetical protein [Candidatus Brocadiales bacterium]